MGQAIYFFPLNPWRLGVLSEAGVRTELIGNCFLTGRGKRPTAGSLLDRGKTMGQAIYSSPLNSWRLERSGLVNGTKLWGRLLISLTRPTN